MFKDFSNFFFAFLVFLSFVFLFLSLFFETSFSVCFSVFPLDLSSCVFLILNVFHNVKNIESTNRKEIRKTERNTQKRNKLHHMWNATLSQFLRSVSFPVQLVSKLSQFLSYVSFYVKLVSQLSWF